MEKHHQNGAGEKKKSGKWEYGKACHGGRSRMLLEEWKKGWMHG